jgi:transposase
VVGQRHPNDRSRSPITSRGVSKRALNDTIEELDVELATTAQANPVAVRMDEVTGVGVLTALAFIVAIEDPSRFENARQVASYMGFVPRESSSGEQLHRGRTTKTGDGMARAYLVQAAWSIYRSKRPEAAPLRLWMAGVEARRGKKVAVTALARRLVRILYALWRDGSRFDVNQLTAKGA